METKDHHFRLSTLETILYGFGRKNKTRKFFFCLGEGKEGKRKKVMFSELEGKSMHSEKYLGVSYA